jgi:catechol 2,3-dioxygenase-like lactoylglutathione lyase family enzyme
MTTSATLVTGVDFVTIFCADLARAEEFYGGVLGLPRSAVYQRDGSPPLGMEFETGTVTLSVVDADMVGRAFEPSTHPIALRVDDVATARAALAARGVAFAVDTLDSGVCHMAFFSDPDGNALMLHHRYAPRAG